MSRVVTGISLRVAASVVSAGALGIAGTAVAARASAVSTPITLPCSPPSGAVSCHPASRTPTLAVNGAVQQIRQIVQCGSKMYAVGRFTRLRSHGQTIHRSNAFSFSATSPYTITNWRPDVNGEVNSIAVGGNCSTAYLGGSFGRVHGASAHNIAAVSISTGALRTRFRHDANKEVDTIVLHRGHLLVGGTFTQINGASHSYYVGLNPTTGVNDRYINLHISGHYSFRGVEANATRVYNQQVSPGGTRLLAEGDFTSVSGRRRQQIFMLSLRTRRATLNAWTSKSFYRNCATIEPFYIRAASWSPDGSTVYTADTGFHPNGGSTKGRRSGLCDAAAAFPAASRTVSLKWINYTGCDSLYSTAAGNGIAYFGGHERWADNRSSCNSPGRYAINAPGMVGLSASGGSVTFDPTRSRGLGADDMLLTKAGLWIASDTFDASKKDGSWCGSSYTTPQYGYAGLCFLRS